MSKPSTQDIEEFDEDYDDMPPSKPPLPLAARLIFLFCISFMILLGGLIAATWIPQDLSDLPGYRQADNAPDIPGLIRQAAKQNASISLTENDVNRYLAAALQARQEGIFSPIARPHGVGVRFHDGYMELILERLLFKQHLQTVSLYVTLKQMEDPSTRGLILTQAVFSNTTNGSKRITMGGKWGILSVPQGYMFFVRPAFEHLAEAAEDLITLIEEHQRIINIRQGEIVLIPPHQS